MSSGFVGCIAQMYSCARAHDLNPSNCLPRQDPAFEYPEQLASPAQILLEASNGASDYGNKFGEPLIAGYTRTFGVRLPNGERCEWIKPIMFRCGDFDFKHAVCTLSRMQLPDPGCHAHIVLSLLVSYVASDGTKNGRDFVSRFCAL